MTDLKHFTRIKYAKIAELPFYTTAAWVKIFLIYFNN